MAIRTVATRGYGNGTFNGTIPLVVTRGYAIGELAATVPSSLVAVMPYRTNVSTAQHRTTLAELPHRTNVSTAND